MLSECEELFQEHIQQYITSFISSWYQVFHVYIQLMPAVDYTRRGILSNAVEINVCAMTIELFMIADTCLNMNDCTLTAWMVLNCAKSLE